MLVGLPYGNNYSVKNMPRDMELLSYEQFGKLRIRDFFPKNVEFFLDEVGSTECAIGPACSEGFAFTYFAWIGEGKMISEIALDFREECPKEIGQNILDTVKLPLQPNISLPLIKRKLGQPEFADLSSNDEGFARFICGKKWPYYVGCHVRKQEGLIAIVIFRKDLAKII